MAKAIDLDQLLQYPLRRGSEHCDEENADPHFLNGVESVLEWAQTLPTLTPPNEALTLEDAKKERYIWFTPLNDWAKVTPFGVLFFGSEELMNWETLCEEWGYRFKAYRRPPEGEA